MIKIIEPNTNEVYAEAEDLETAWQILAKLVEEANAKNIPFYWGLYDTKKGEFIL